MKELHLTLKPEGWAVVDVQKEPVIAMWQSPEYESAWKASVASANLIVPDQQEYAEDLILTLLGGVKDKLLEQGEVYRVPFEGEIELIDETCKWMGDLNRCGNETCWDLKECQKSPSLKLAYLIPKNSVKERSEPVGEGEKEIKFAEWVDKLTEQEMRHGPSGYFERKTIKELFEEYKTKMK